ncbi:MAG: DJ-1/PfpI/YhbO family deglycase/protease [Acidobacteriota bacterium]
MTEHGARVAILIEDGFDDEELSGAIERLSAAGLQVTIVGPFANRAYTGRHGRIVASGMTAVAARKQQFDAIVIPGGYSPDRIRMRHAMLDLVREALTAGRTVGAIGHGAQVLISADAVAGRTLTCWPSIAVDLKNAGGMYVDRPVVEDGGVITARKADDLPQFASAIVTAVARSRGADGIQSRP